MRPITIAMIMSLFGALLFGAGFFLGRQTTDLNSAGINAGSSSESNENDPGLNLSSARRLGSTARNSERGDRSNRQEDRDHDGPKPDDEDKRSSKEVIDEIKEKIAAGDRHGIQESLGYLWRKSPGSMSEEEIADWAKLLREGDPRYTHEVAHAFMRAAGAKGAKEVLKIVLDEDMPLEIRREFLHSFNALKPDQVPQVTPLLEDFLVSSPGRELSRTAAHIYGRIQGKDGFSKLLNLMNQKPEVRTESVYDALGELGGTGDASKLLDLIDTNISQREKRSLLHAAGRMAARSGDHQMLLDLIQSPPQGFSKRELARALGDAAQSAPLSFFEKALLETKGDRQAQAALAEAIAHRGGREALDLLMESASNPDVGLDQRALAHALSEFQGSEVIPEVMELLKNTTDPEQYEPLTRSLLQHGTSDQIDTLIKELNEGSNRTLQRAIAETLSHSEIDLGVDRYIELINNSNDHQVQEQLSEALRRGSDHDPDYLNNLLQNTENQQARIALLKALEETSQPAPINQLAQGLTQTQEDRELWQYSRLLSGRGDQGMQQINQYLNNESYGGHRHAVLEGLLESRSIHTEAGKKVALDVAQYSNSHHLRNHAIRGLAERGDSSLVPEFAAILAQEKNEDVRTTIQEAIQELSPSK